MGAGKGGLSVMARDDEQDPPSDDDGADGDGIVVNWTKGFEPDPDDDDPPPPSEWNPF